MLRAFCLAVSIFLLPLAPISAEAPPKPGGNAALTYWQAFPQLPKLSDAETLKLYADCVTMPLDARVKELLTNERTEYALRMMHRGAARPHCEWDIAYEEGIGALLPNAEAARTLAALACLRARQEFAQGKTAEAIDDIVAGLALGRHTAENGVFIQLVLGYSIEHRMIETLALLVPKLDAKAITALKTRLDALPAGGNPVAAMAFEVKSCPDWLERRIKEAKSVEGVLAFLGPLSLRQGDSPAKGRDASRAFLEECGGTVEGVLKRIEEMRQFYAFMSPKMALPVNQFKEEFEREMKKRAASNPAIRQLFPALDRVRLAQARINVRRAMLAAALAVQAEGQGALKNHPDPVAGGPFEYTAFDGGFELRSKFNFENKPLMLTVGQRAP